MPANIVLAEEAPGGGQTYQWYYDAFVAKLQELSGTNKLIVSAAPECKQGCPDPNSGNCNPLAQTVKITQFDYLL